MIFLYFVINILHYGTCYLVTLVQSYRINYEFEFWNILENYHKIVWTAITHSSHHVKAIDFKTGKILREQFSKPHINQKKLLSLQIYNIICLLFGSLRVWYHSKHFLIHKYYIFHKSLIILSFYICLYHSFQERKKERKQILIRHSYHKGVPYEKFTLCHLSG